MKILIASGIFLPEVGGPASFATSFASELISQGHEVAVVTYSDTEKHMIDQELAFPVWRIKRGNKLLNYWRYYRKIKSLAAKFDLVYALDHFSAGFPASMACHKTGRKLFVRIGGDFLWERYVSGTKAVTLKQYYQAGLYAADRWRMSMMKSVFEQAKKIIFTTDFQKKIFEKYYDIDPAKTVIVPNALPEKPAVSRQMIGNEIIFAGRFVGKNNIEGLLSAWQQIKSDKFTLSLIGDGPEKSNLEKQIKKLSRVKIVESMSRKELLEKISQAYLVIFPSLTDISPNLMLECLSMGVPFISSREVGFDWIVGKVKTFDPFDNHAMAGYIEELAHEDIYQKYADQLKQIEYSYSYPEAVSDTLKIFEI